MRIAWGNNILYLSALVLVYENLHLRAILVLQDSIPLKIAVWFLRICNVTEFLVTAIIFTYLLVDPNLNTLQFLNHPLVKVYVKTVAATRTFIGFIGYSTFEILTIRKITEFRESSVKFKSNFQVLSYIKWTMLVRSTDIASKLAVILGATFPFDVYLHIFDIIFTLYSTRMCEEMIKKTFSESLTIKSNTASSSEQSATRKGKTLVIDSNNG
ncbi:hypothetical protein HK096_001481, partial [Nowakowskiella sp. JEL0078]